MGSLKNDGVWNATDILKDEEFNGAVWLMAVPPAVVKLANDIDTWQTGNAQILNSPFQSESFGGYSYNKGSGADNSGVVNWQTFFKKRLNKWRKL